MPEVFYLPDPAGDVPDWQVVIRDGRPERVLNRAVIEVLIKESPLGEVEARRRLAAAGFPFGDGGADQ